MEDFVNKELDYIKINCFIEQNGTEVNGDVGEISKDTENEDVIHRHINVNKTETNKDGFEQVIKECPSDTPIDMMQ